MGKTKAQRKKEYRERLKEKNNEKYQTESLQRKNLGFSETEHVGINVRSGSWHSP